MIYERPYLIEILTPKMDFLKPNSRAPERFAQRYIGILESGCAVSIPDNPAGNIRFSAVETRLAPPEVSCSSAWHMSS